MTDKEKLREIKIEQEPTQVTWRRCTQCNAAQMEFQLREGGICQECYVKNLEKENAELSNSVLEFSNSVIELTNAKTELEKQIEKMKTHENCKYNKTSVIDFPKEKSPCSNCQNKDKWEFSE